MTRTLAFQLFVAWQFLHVIPHAPAEDAPIQPFTKYGNDVAVIFPDTKSADGRFAVGWTLKATKGAASVDWPSWGTVNPRTWLDRYKWSPNDPVAPYRLENCVVDLMGEAILPLPSDWPEWPNKNRGYIAAAWGDEHDGRRFGLVQNDSRFYTHNLWLVRIASNRMRQTDISGRLSKAVRRFLRLAKGKKFEQFGVFFPVANSEAGGRARFARSLVDIPFLANVPKSGPDIEGVISVSLPDAKILQISRKP